VGESADHPELVTVTPSDVAVHKRIEDLTAAVRTEVAGTPAASFSLLAALDEIQRAAATDDLRAAREIAEHHVVAAKRSLELTRKMRTALDDLAAVQTSVAHAPAPMEIAIEDIRAQPDQESERRRWALHYARSLAARDVGQCQQLAGEHFAFFDSLPILRDVVRDSTAALTGGQVDRALPLLRYLAGALAQPEPATPEDRHALAAVLVLIGRVHLVELSDEEGALRRIRQARGIAPDSGLPEAARAIAHYRRREFGRGLVKAQRSVELAPQRPEGYVALAMCAEAQSAPEAADLYEKALDRVSDRDDPLTALGLFIGELPDTLLVELARRAVKARQPEVALAAIDDAPVQDDPDAADEVRWRSEADEYELRARALAIQHQTDEAADAMCDAVDRLNWAGDVKRSLDLVRDAIELAPGLSRARWLLADLLRVDSAIPDPPYVDSARVGEALKSWEAGARSAQDGLPAWSLWVRAAIEESRARLPRHDAHQCRWAAVAFAESGLIAQPASAPTYASLTRYLSQLEHSGAAAEASERALEHDPDNVPALEERLVLLVNTGRFEQVDDVVARLPPSPWLDSVRAYTLSRTGEPQRALDELQSALDQLEQLDLWQHQLLAYCHMQLGHPDEARAAWKTIWGLRNPQARDDQLAFAWAAWHLGEADEALTMAADSRDDPVDHAEALRLAGLCELALGRLEPARADLFEGIRATSNVQTLDEFGDIAVDEAEARADSDEARTLCAEARQWIAGRREELAKEDGAAEDFARAIAGATADPPDWAWIGAQAGLARLAAQDGRWTDAADRYEELARRAPRFTGAALGLQRALGGLRDTGDTLLSRGDADGAAAAYREALERLSPQADEDDSERFALLVRLGLAELETGGSGAAEGRLAEALEVFAGDPAAASAAVGDLTASLARDPGHHWRVSTEWAALAERWPAGRREVLEGARERLLDRLQAAFEADGYLAYQAPTVIPLQVEVSEGTLPDPAAEGVEALTARMVELVGLIRDATGVVIPQPTLSVSGQVAGDYRILLDEAVVASGHVEAASVPGQARRALVAPSESIVRHLEAVIRASLHTWVGVQEVENMLQREGEGIDGFVTVLTALPDHSTRLRFARLLRELAREGVPIGTWDPDRRSYSPDPHDVLTAASDEALHAETLALGVRALRRHLHKRLPGNEPGVDRVRLPSSWESGMTREAGGRVSWRPPGEVAFGYLAAVRSYVGRADRPVALVTDNAELRPLIRRFVAIELPEVPVLAAEELRDPEASLSVLPVDADGEEGDRESA
jgi:tetratricopeptide (TPR) repeat protein